ncbi:MAG: F0F1 ATP synthase subunit gamma [Anaerolineales bacterium]|nr:F0F1 ATP synthase subunit gamma [Anaerolineales bacterium]
MKGSGRAEERLENIQSVEPILNALRTVSQASMQTARRKLEGAARYGSEILELASWLPGEAPGRMQAGARRRTLLVVLGSDRGLCGTFNSDLVEVLSDLLAQMEEERREVEVWILGHRLKSSLDREEILVDHVEGFAEGSVPDFQRALRLAESIQAGFKEGRFGRVLILMNKRLQAERTRSEVEQLLPMKMKDVQGKAERWPPPILETDPEELRERIRKQAVEVNLYRFLLISSAAEHAARFHLLENASQNMERLTEELEMEVQLARQQAITTEMMDLIAAAGLIKP